MHAWSVLRVYIYILVARHCTGWVAGITGMGDVTPLAHLTADLLGSFPPASGEALPLIAQSSFVTAYAALALHDTRALLGQCVVMGGLDLEAFAANPSPFHPSVAAVRPYPGFGTVIARMNELLQGSRLLAEAPRALQPPLSFRCTASVLGNHTCCVCICMCICMCCVVL